MAKITKRKWEQMGGFRNSYLFRRDTPDGWTYHVSDLEFARLAAGRMKAETPPDSDPAQVYQCDSCGLESDEPFDQCEQCGVIDQCYLVDVDSDE
jgi:hypothetical protein